MNKFVIPDIQPVNGINDTILPGIGSGLEAQSIGGGLFKVYMPDGSEQIVNGFGEVISSN